MDVEYFVKASAKLSHLVRNDLKFHIYLYEHFNEIDLFLNNGKPLRHGAVIHTIRLSLQCSLILQLSNHLSKSDAKSVKIEKLLNFAASNFDRIPWETPPKKSWLNEQNAKIEKIAPTISKLKTIRNEYFAHVDAQHLLDPDSSLANFVPTLEEIFNISNTIVSILNSIDRHLGRPPQIPYDAWFDAECREFTEKLLANVVGGTREKKSKVMGRRQAGSIEAQKAPGRTQPVRARGNRG